MHSRRRFIAALDRGDTRAALPVAAYKKLYEIEEKIRDLDPDVRLATRTKESRPVWEELIAWCQAYQPHEPPSSPLGDAIRYLLNHREALGRFLEDEMIPPDNGIVERLHVRAALTRKNFLFAGSDAGGERAAIAYTMLACCRLAGVNPVEYLGDLLPRLSRRVRIADLPALLPAQWEGRSGREHADGRGRPRREHGLTGPGQAQVAGPRGCASPDGHAWATYPSDSRYLVNSRPRRHAAGHEQARAEA